MSTVHYWQHWHTLHFLSLDTLYNLPIVLLLPSSGTGATDKFCGVTSTLFALLTTCISGSEVDTDGVLGPGHKMMDGLGYSIF